MFLVAGIVGGIKGLFLSPAYIMRDLAVCLRVLLFLPPVEIIKVLRPTQFYRMGD